MHTILSSALAAAEAPTVGDNVRDVLTNIGLALLFVLIGGVFSAAEMALVSLRESQVRSLAQRGKRGQIVERLSNDPNRFLSTVQVGVTLSGFLASAFAGATLAEDLSPVFVGWGLPEGVASAIALILITLAVSYVSIVLGELAAKRLALQRAEAFSLALGPIIERVARGSRPIVWFLSKSTTSSSASSAVTRGPSASRCPTRSSAPSSRPMKRSATRNARSSRRSSRLVSDRSARSWCLVRRSTSWTRAPPSSRP